MLDSMNSMPLQKEGMNGKKKFKKPMMEQDETPQSEAQNHPPSFLKKAAKLAGKKSIGQRLMGK